MQDNSRNSQATICDYGCCHLFFEWVQHIRTRNSDNAITHAKPVEMSRCMEISIRRFLDVVKHHRAAKPDGVLRPVVFGTTHCKAQEWWASRLNSASRPSGGAVLYDTDWCSIKGYRFIPAFNLLSCLTGIGWHPIMCQYPA